MAHDFPLARKPFVLTLTEAEEAAQDGDRILSAREEREEIEAAEAWDYGNPHDDKD